ncbi:MAG: MBL fold metallo-hydrolase [Synergistaceae bacterium]|jgi:glyoxylase-like metal-dependent hydrolase (beta-lactamase superfamily II)|nr:MBL fold metallo-hydrolase [Synergistaceae bacterium]
MRIKCFQLGALWTNCYVVWSGDGDAIIVDPGGPAAEVREFVAHNGLRVRKILLTHGHGDHIMGLGDVRDMASDGVSIHSQDADCLTSASKNLSSAMGAGAVFKPADFRIGDGEVIYAGDMSIRVMHTPGHTKGGCCFYITEGDEELLLSGDTLFARSVGRTDLPGGDEGELIESLKKLDAYSDALKVYPGHGPATTLGDERRLNPFWPAAV